MRKLITGLFVAGMSLAAAEAQAAQEAWKCIGAAYVCGESESPSNFASAPKSSKAYGNKYGAKKHSAKKHSTKKYSAKKRSTKTYKKAAAPSRGSTTGKASYYWQPQRVASGGWFNPNAMTAAHKTLPFGTKVRVTNQRNGRSVVVKINDRGPYVKGRIIDLSKAAAHSIGMQNAGVVPVSVEVLGKS